MCTEHWFQFETLLLVVAVMVNYHLEKLDTNACFGFVLSVIVIFSCDFAALCQNNMKKGVSGEKRNFDILLSTTWHLRHCW